MIVNILTSIPLSLIRMATKNDENFIAFCDELITSRRVIFTPYADIKDELKKTSINITCYNKDGEIVKRVTSTDDAEVEDPDNDNPDGGGDNGGSTSGSGSQTRQYALNISSANTAQGTVNDSVNKSYTEGSRVTITATPKSGYQFEKWSDGNTQASRSLTIDKAYTLVASFKEASTSGEDTGNTGGGGSDTPMDFM